MLRRPVSLRKLSCSCCGTYIMTMPMAWLEMAEALRRAPSPGTRENASCNTCQIQRAKPSRKNISAVQFSSVTQLCPTLCDLMNCCTPGCPVHHQLPESTQSLVHRVGDAIQPSHPLSSPSPPALNLSQHQGLFK